MVSTSGRPNLGSPSAGSSPPLVSVDLHLDRELYERIVEDMGNSAGMHAPADMWKPARLFPNSEKKQTSPTFQDLVAPWIGSAAMKLAPPDLIRSCAAFLQGHGAESGVPEFGLEPSMSDLRTVLDVALIRRYVSQMDSLRVLEVGGGYGRLAEAFLQLGSPRVTYLMIDAVPVSLYFAYAYLRQRFPGREIGLYYVDPGPDISRYDCYIAPVWHFDGLETPLYDVGVNIASMQEMTREQVEWYLALLDRLVREDGIIYLSNTRDYAYGHEYDYPDNWQLVFKENTPLSWSPHYPVEILAKGGRDWSLENATREVAYLRLRQANDRLRQANDRLRSALARKTEALAAQRAENARLREENESFRRSRERLRIFSRRKN
jgi:SAM-dependent methyltransferase